MSADARRRKVFRNIGRQLAAATGSFDHSPFWAREYDRFYRHPSALRMVERVGRGGDKSRTAEHFAIAEMLCAEPPPAGELHYFAWVSENVEEAAQRPMHIEAKLKALGVACTRVSDTVVIDDLRIGFKSFACRVGAVSGFRAIGFVCDEEAKWRSASGNANPAREVVASLRAMCVTRAATAREVHLSSPVATVDYHAELFDLGNTAAQIVGFAASWDANPGITQESTRAREDHEQTWKREYGAIPSEGIESLIGPEELSAITSSGTKKRAPIPDGHYFVFLDVGLRFDRSAFVVAHKEMRDRGFGGGLVDTIVIDAVQLLKPEFFGLRRVAVDDVVRVAVALSREFNRAPVLSDLHYADAIGPQLREFGVQHRELSMASPAQTARIQNLQGRISNRTLDFVDNEDLRREFLEAQLIFHSGGRLTLSAPARKSAHDDVLDCVLLACDAEGAARLPYTSGSVIVEYQPVYWLDHPSNIQGGNAKYFTRGASGNLVPAEPAFGSLDWLAWKEEREAEGITTPSIARWRQENEGTPIQKNEMTIRVINN